MDVWCAIPTPETECEAEQVYVPTPVRSEDLAGGYVRRGGAFGPDDVLITMQLLACVRHMEPRRNVWGIMRPGDTRRKRVADFGARSFRELLLRMAAEGYAE